MILLIDIGTRISLYASLAIALNLLVGHAGLLLLSQSVFIGVGAYVAAICMINTYGFTFSFLAAVLVTLVTTIIVYLPLLRLRVDSFAVASLAVSLCFVGLLNNLDSYTNGPEGLSIPRYPIFSDLPSRQLELFLFALALLVIVVIISRWIIKLPFGRTLHAVRDDELAAASLGKKPWVFLFRVGLICGAISGAVGVLLATYTTHLTPESFSLDLSITILAAAILGGLGSSLGAVIGASAIVLISEILRSAFPSLTIAEADRILFGVFLLATLRFYPKGLMGNTSLR